MAGRIVSKTSRMPVRHRTADRYVEAGSRRRTGVDRGNNPMVGGEEILRAFGRNSWFRNLPAEIATRIVSATTLKRYEEDELVHAKYEEATRLYGVISGGVRASSMSADGQESVFAFMGVGSWFGLGALLDGLTRTHDIRTCQPTVLATIGRRDFNLLLQEYPILYKHFALQLCEVVRAAFTVIEDEALLHVQARFAKRLVALADLYGVPHGNGTLIQLHLPQQDLASILHVTRATINKKLVEWQRLKWIDMHYGQIIVLNRAALEQLYVEH